MDSGKVYLFEIRLTKGWFTTYESLAETPIIIGVRTLILSNVLKTRDKKQGLAMSFNPNSQDVLTIVFSSETSGELTKDFEIPLMDVDPDILDTGSDSLEYDCEFSMQSAAMFTVIGQLGDFGENCLFDCSEDILRLCADGETNGKMRVTIPFKDIESYVINEGEVIQVTFGLGNLRDICKCRLTDEVFFSIHKTQPMKVAYYLDKENECYMRFFIASRVELE